MYKFEIQSTKFETKIKIKMTKTEWVQSDYLVILTLEF
jgi:hypothetical protein